jgi:5-methylcytosine-specific restriction endonuclease McrA
VLEHQDLARFAVDVRRQLKEMHGLTIRGSLKVRKSDTDGICVTVTRIDGDICCEIWHDRWMIGGRWRQLYCGISSETRSGRQEVGRLAGELSRESGAPCHRLDDSCPTRVVRRGQWILQDRYRLSVRGELVYEDYESSKITWLGKYTTHQPTADAATWAESVEEVASFFARLLDPTGEGRMASGEERRRSRHIRIETTVANRAAMRSRKVRDDFICQVCKLDPARLYGADIGAEIADAHHIIPLKDLKTRRTITVEDLITVCPNCHRALHRMEGKADDVTRLRRIIARLRQTGSERHKRSDA